MPPRDFFAIFRTLGEYNVDYILVGGLSSVLQGAPINTFDVDIVHSRVAANIERLLGALQSLDAFFRIQPERRLTPSTSHLSGTGHLNLLTQYGPLDVLCTIGENLAYSDILPHSTETDLGDGLRVRVLNLDKLIEIKEELNTEKDRAVLPILRRTLEEKKKLG